MRHVIMRERFHPRLLPTLCAMLLLALLPAGCADDSSSGLEIAGSYTDDFGTHHEISADEWTMDFGTGFGTASFTVLQFSNGADYLVARNGSDNAFNPDQYSRFNWTRFEAVLYFCQDPYAAESEAEAAATDRVERSDPTAGGCGGFPWSRLTPQ